MKDVLLRWARRLGILVGVLAVLFGLMQLVPYGRTHSNPDIRAEPEWDSPRTRELAVRACFDCHSNETKWPWYANVAPMSWMVEHDVEKARAVINYSEMHKAQKLAPYSALSVSTRGMPPAKYRMAHPEADLTEAETLELIHGLEATFGRP